jgi:hypothetical protein
VPWGYDVAKRVDHTLALRVVSLVVRAAREKRGACLGVLAARRSSVGLGAAVREASPGECTLRRAVGVRVMAPAARARLRWWAECLGVPAARRGSFGLGAASDGARRGRRAVCLVCTGSRGARAAALGL